MKHPTLFLIIAFCTLAIAANSQLKRSSLFTKQNEELPFCSQNILLDSLGYYFKEKGCEGSGEISFGKYSLSKAGIVTFLPLPFSVLQPIRKIKRSEASDLNDSIITITFYDRYDKPLHYNFNIIVLKMSGEDWYPATDENGQLALNRKTDRDVVINSLLNIFGQSPSIVNGDESTIEVYLDLPDLFLGITEVTLKKEKQSQLILKKNKLYKLDGKTLVYTLN
jgi:hypothetical protein